MGKGQENTEKGGKEKLGVGMFLEENGHAANEPGNGYERFYEPELGL